MRTLPILACGGLRYREEMRWLARWGLLIVGAAVMFAGAVSLIIVASRSSEEVRGVGALPPTAHPGFGIAIALIAVGLVGIVVWFAIRYGRRR
jgi:divalent metal cation (Fe/Co/Zn/Cd) transporter